MKYFEGDPLLFDAAYIKAVKESNKRYLKKSIDKRYQDAYFDHTKIGLFMLLGLLTNALTDKGITKTAVHPFYNDYYNKIFNANSLSTLKTIEINLTSDFSKRFNEDQLKTSNPLVDKLLSYIHLHLEDKIELKTMADKLSYSESHIKKRFKETMNEPITSYITRAKIEYSKTLLTMALSVSEVASILHFYDAAHYIKTFKKYYSFTPKQFQLGGCHE
ncbi:MAG: helix-turn-helix domain-containing protein [Candidatus Izemoplasmataceae bacterium]